MRITGFDIGFKHADQCVEMFFCVGERAPGNEIEAEAAIGNVGIGIAGHDVDGEDIGIAGFNGAGSGEDALHRLTGGADAYG